MSAAEHRPAHGGRPAPEHRCYGCGSDDPMACGTLCADCSWEEHLASIAHTGPAAEPDRPVPECCERTRAERSKLFAELVPDGTYGNAREVKPNADA